jgi:hypothetical protein
VGSVYLAYILGSHGISSSIQITPAGLSGFGLGRDYTNDKNPAFAVFGLYRQILSLIAMRAFDRVSVVIRIARGSSIV